VSLYSFVRRKGERPKKAQTTTELLGIKRAKPKAESRAIRHIRFSVSVNDERDVATGPKDKENCTRIDIAVTVSIESGRVTTVTEYQLCLQELNNSR